MTTYNVHFNTDSLYADSFIDADTPEQALEKAKRIATDEPESLDYYAREHDGINVIEVWDGGEKQKLAVWQHGDESLRLAARDLLDALTDLVERDRAEAADSGFTDDEMSWLEDARRAIAKAKGGAP